MVLPHYIRRPKKNLLAVKKMNEKKKKYLRERNSGNCDKKKTNRKRGRKLFKGEGN